MSHDPVTHVPVWLDASQPLGQLGTTLALLRVWQRARPQQVRVDVYVRQDAPELTWATVRN